jgi:hypothetical protein
MKNQQTQNTAASTPASLIERLFSLYANNFNAAMSMK